MSHLITLITKAIDTTSISYQSTFMVMLLEGRHLQFFVHKKLDPSSLQVGVAFNDTAILRPSDTKVQ